MNESRIPDAQVVGRSRVQILSLIEIRRPSKRDFDLPASWVRTSDVGGQTAYPAHGVGLRHGRGLAIDRVAVE